MSSSAATERQPVNSASLDLLVNAYYEYLLGAGAGASAPLPLAAREDIFERVESVGYRIGRQSLRVRAGRRTFRCRSVPRRRRRRCDALRRPRRFARARAPAGRYAERLARDRERLSDALDVMKFICREFWTDVFRKVGGAACARARAALGASAAPPLTIRARRPPPQPVDKLQTNNKGTFLLQDLNFRWAKYISGTAADEPGAVALKFTVFCCGLLRGALAAFDLNMVVHVDVSALPKAVFQVRAVEA